MQHLRHNIKRLLIKRIEQGTDFEAFSIQITLGILSAYRKLSNLSSNIPAIDNIFTPPSQQRTPFVIAQVLFGMTIVLTTALATSHISPGMLLTIPAYAIYATIILVIRQQKLNDARKIKVGAAHLYLPISPLPNPMHRRDMARKRK